MIKQLTNVLLALAIFALGSVTVNAQVFEFKSPDSEHGLILKSTKSDKVEMTFSLQSFSMDKIIVNGEMMDKLQMPGSYLPADEGTPDLPSIGRYIAIPQESHAKLTVKSYKTEHYSDVEVSPAPRIPAVSDDSPLHYEKEAAIYQKDAFYPANPFMLSENMKIRGVDAVILGVSPFQYNPVTKELIVYTDVELEVSYEGGNNHFGEDRLRSRFWEPILQDMIVNYSSLPEVDFYPENAPESKNTNFEYVIITPDNPSFIMWADSLRRFRNRQGIKTGVFQLQQIGGNNAGAIETFVNNAYNTWQIPPSAVLLMADYGNSGDKAITSPMHDNYCVSDNIYADVDGDNLPEIAFARMTAQNEGHLETMIGKIISYETNPPTNPDFYLHPVSAGGWQTERWFILCAEVCRGFWENELGKEPVREYAIYSGTPGSSWSTNSNTATVVNYFGPNGLGYIPADPSGLTDWGGNATRINADINSGAFMLMHRDHGMETGWGEPSYTNGNLSGLDNDDLTFVLSINCLTGKYNYSSTCFAEAFHRHEKGCTGIIAASETSYSFVNDAYCWGMFDNMWGNFDPGYGVDPVASDWTRPCFANASGKFYLAASSWPSNPNNKVVTYHLFHHHGDAFQTVYYNMPEDLTVTHPEEITPGTTTMEVTADNGATVCLSSNGYILDVELSSGSPITLNFEEVTIGTVLKLTVTKQNYFRYEEDILVVGPPAAAVSPSPSNNQTKVDIFSGLTWDGSGADYYEVYFGTDNPPTNIVNGEQVTEMTYAFAETLDFNQQYYWQIVSVNNYGTTGSEVWNFTAAGEPDEDFETGDFSLHSWQHSGDAQWTVIDSDAKHGSYSAQSGAIDNGQTSVLKIDIDCSGFEKIKFYKKVSSEADADKLVFLIDGTVKAEWSGEIDWSYEQFTSGPGPHSFEWRYEKDASGAAGSDMAAIDFIYLPPTAALSATAGDDTEICESNTYTTSGFASNQTSIEWTTDGDGSFEDPASLATIYTPGTMDIDNGSVVLTLTAYAGTDQISDNLTLTINPNIVLNVDGGVVCEAGTTLDWISAENYVSLLWTTSGDGTFDNAEIVNPVYTPGSGDLSAGVADLTLSAVAMNGCADAAEVITVAVMAPPEKPSVPDGPETVDVYYTPESVYTTTGNADEYQWDLNPVAAGELTPDGNTVTILWSETFQGTAEIKVSGSNSCGASEFSEALPVIVDNTVGINSYDREIGVTPNPSNGEFVISIATATMETVIVTITSADGRVIDEQELVVDGQKTIDYHNEALSSGIYYLTIKTQNKDYIKKLIIK